MALPVPETGLVIRYSYLWREEARQGRQEGSKDRPCAVVLAVSRGEIGTTVVVAPITHAPPRQGMAAIEMPRRVSLHLGLDDEQSWIIASELNAFEWPGPDLRLIDRKNPDKGFVYGHLPKRLALEIVALVRTERLAGRLDLTKRNS